MSLKFVKWDIHWKPCKESGDYLVKAILKDKETDKEHEWFPKEDDLNKGIGAVATASKINKLHRKK